MLVIEFVGAVIIFLLGLAVTATESYSHELSILAGLPSPWRFVKPYRWELYR